MLLQQIGVDVVRLRTYSSRCSDLCLATPPHGRHLHSIVASQSQSRAMSRSCLNACDGGALRCLGRRDGDVVAGAGWWKVRSSFGTVEFIGAAKDSKKRPPSLLGWSYMKHSTFHCCKRQAACGSPPGTQAFHPSARVQHNPYRRIGTASTFQSRCRGWNIALLPSPMRASTQSSAMLSHAAK